jgi:CheY-like chemotaxis protein
VLDDEPEIAVLVCRALAKIGVVARHFANPLQFLAEVRICAPDIVVLDLALGASDAIDVMRKLEVLKFTGRVLLISGRDRGVLEKVEGIGRTRGLLMLPSLTKPFRAADLQRALNEAVPDPGAPRARDAGSIKRPMVDLKEALANGWLELWYQPKFDLANFSICGAEALVRARAPDGGVVSPIDLLPPAGDSSIAHCRSTFCVERFMIGRSWRNGGIH